jgi:hypothetical protein
VLRDYVSQVPQARKPVGYDRNFLDSYRSNSSSYLTEQDRTHLATVGRLQIADQPAGTYAKHILNRLLIDLAWNSSRLEGNTYSLLDTKNLMAEMKLLGMFAAYDQALTDATRDQVGYSEFLDMLLQAETDYRQERKTGYRIKAARFTLRPAFEDIDFTASRSIPGGHPKSPACGHLKILHLGASR